MLCLRKSHLKLHSVFTSISTTAIEHSRLANEQTTKGLHRKHIRISPLGTYVQRCKRPGSFRLYATPSETTSQDVVQDGQPQRSGTVASRKGRYAFSISFAVLPVVVRFSRIKAKERGPDRPANSCGCEVDLTASVIKCQHC